MNRPYLAPFNEDGTAYGVALYDMETMFPTFQEMVAGRQGMEYRLMAASASIVVLATVMVACAPAAPDLTDEEQSTIEEEITSMQTEFADAWREVEFDRGMSYFDDHPDFGFAFDAGTWNSVASVDRAFRPVFAELESQEIRVDERRIMVLSRDAVHVFERGAFSQRLADGTSTDEVPFAFTILWVRSDGEWKVRFAHESTPSSP